jgi:hypothetical protein
MRYDALTAMAAIHRHYLELRGLPPSRHGHYAGPFSRGLWWTLDPWVRGLRAFAHGFARPSANLRQLHQLPRFLAQFRVDPDAYYRYGLYRDWKRRAQYMFHDEIVAVLNDINARTSAADTEILFDKRAFRQRCREAGLPTIPIFAEFDAGVCQDVDRDDVHLQADLFSKFANRYCGEGAALWTYEDGRYRNRGELLTLGELKSLLASQATQYPIILQPRVTNHGDLATLSGNGLSTVRVITIRNPGAAPQVALACYRMPTGKSVADNFAAGGIAAGVNLETGVLGSAATKANAALRLREHPDSGAAIEGRTLPKWREVCDLALAAHRAFASMVSVGWDVAITADGPVLVEGNAVWCVDLAQISSGRPLAATPIPACLSQYLERAHAFTNADMPGPIPARSAGMARE